MKLFRNMSENSKSLNRSSSLDNLSGDELSHAETENIPLLGSESSQDQGKSSEAIVLLHIESLFVAIDSFLIEPSMLESLVNLYDWEDRGTITNRSLQTFMSCFSGIDESDIARIYAECQYATIKVDVLKEILVNIVNSQVSSVHFVSCPVCRMQI